MSSGDTAPLNRRKALGLLGAGVAGAASGTLATRWLLGRTASHDSASGPSGPAPAATTVPTAAQTTTTRTPPERAVGSQSTPEIEPYEPLAGEVLPAAKVAAAAVAEALVNYSDRADFDAAVTELMAAATPTTSPPPARAALELLYHEGVRSTGGVVYPQYGGLRPHSAPTSASVIVIVDQILGTGPQRERVSRCLDIRLALDDGEWRFEEVADVSGEPVAAPPSPTEPAARVLAHPGISLPDAARWDIHEGLVSEKVLLLLAELADEVELSVTSFKRGHPVNVFGTPDLSAHGVGRAVDVWSVGGVPVVSQRYEANSVAQQVAVELASSGKVTNLGSPWSITGATARTWTDPVHKDHLHLGVGY